MNQDNLIDLIIDKKQFRNYKLISRGRFSATVDLDYKNKEKRTSVLILMKKESEARIFDFEKIENQYTVRAFQYEYNCRLQAYLVYTDAGECTLQDKISDKAFRKCPEAIEAIFNWIKAVTLGLKKLHSDNYVHLNLQASSILITSENKAKIGVLNFARHSSTLDKRYEIGLESYQRPPECVAGNFQAADGKKMDTWSLAVMIIEALTNNYLGQKSNEISSWPKQYAILHKILQENKFKKAVKKEYPNAVKGEYLGTVLRFIKHILKVCPDERPDIGEFLILLMKTVFLKHIDKELTEEKLWIKKVSLKDLEHEIMDMVLEPQQSNAGKETKDKYGDEYRGEMLTHNYDQTLEVHHIPPDLQAVLTKNTLPEISVENKNKTKEAKVITPIDGLVSKAYPEKMILKEQENFKSKINEIYSKNTMMGDFESDALDNKRKDISSYPFEHAYLHLSEISSAGTKSSTSENIGQPDSYEKACAKNDLSDKANEGTLLAKRQKSDFRRSDIPLLDLVTIDPKEKHVVTQIEVTGKDSKEKNQEKTSSCIFTAKRMLGKVISWAVEEKFYIGVMRSGSFIDDLSKALTG